MPLHFGWKNGVALHMHEEWLWYTFKKAHQLFSSSANTIRLQQFFFHLMSVFVVQIGDGFPFQTCGWLLSILSAENKTKLWTGQMELHRKKMSLTWGRLFPAISS